MSKYTPEEQIDIANTIMRQTGGYNRLKAIVGAYDALALDAGLQFSFKGSRKANKITIELTPNDNYNVKIYKIGRMNKNYDKPVTLVDETAGAYADMLIPLFEKATGLYLHL